MAALDNKYIPLLDSTMYSIDIMPKAVAPDGRRRSAEEIKRGTKQLIHTVYIDTTGNVYMIPAKYEDGQWVDVFSPTDIVNAAMGDEEAKAKLQECRSELKAYYGKDVMSDGFMQRLYEKEQDGILQSINARRQEDGEELIVMDLPESPKTATNFTREELSTVLATAQPIKSSGQVPPEG